jgi:hypothetical protein
VHLRAAASADDVDVENSLEQLVPGPSVARGQWCEVFAWRPSGGLGDDRRLRPGGRLGGGGAGLALRVARQQGLQRRPNRRAGGEHSVKADQIHPLGRNRGDKPTKEVLGRQHDFALPGVVGFA